MNIQIIKTECGLLKILSKNDVAYESYFVTKGKVTDVVDLTNLSVGYKLVGTPFQKLVWREIVTIPYGETRTYGQIAKAIGRPTAYRAVANACGQNKLAVIIPCHRVVGASSLGGYKWGPEIKQWLIDFEKN